MTPLELQKPVVEEKHVEEEKNKKNVSSKTNGNKWLYALYVTILFLVVSMPVTYKFTNTLLKSVCVLASKNGCPTMCGILVHALVFLLLLRLSVNFTSIYEGLTKKQREKLKKKRKKLKKKLTDEEKRKARETFQKLFNQRGKKRQALAEFIRTAIEKQQRQQYL